MSHRFQIVCLRFNQPISKSRVFCFRIKISQSYWFKTSEQQATNNNIIPFLESNQFQVPEGIPLYYGLELIEVKNEGNCMIDKKILFEKDINKKLQFTIDGIIGVLQYSIIISNREDRKRRITGEISKKLKQHVEEFSEANSQTKLQIMRMGGLYYNFVNRLDHIVKIKNYLREIVRWTNSIYTIMFGIAITLMILIPGISLILGSLTIILSKNKILNFAQDFSSPNKNKTRLIVPKQNFILLQTSMDLYCQTYQHIKRIVQSEDKTELIILINTVIGYAWILLFLPIFFNLKDLFIIALWTLLVLQHPKGKQMKSVLLKMKRQLIFQIVKLLQNFSSKNKFFIKLLKFVQMPERQITVIKTFYVYQFQNWWFGIWDEPPEGTLKWSDKTNTIGILPRDQPAKGFSWTSQWLIDVNPNTTDKEGFQYATKLSIGFHQHNSLLDTIRRRKWKRISITQSIQGSSKLKLDWIVDGNLPSSRAHKYKIN